MDLIVLQRLTDELAKTLAGQRIEQVWALPDNDVVIAVGRRSDPRLWFSAEPDDPHLYLRSGPHRTPQRPPGFAMAARRVLNGRRVATLELVQRDRIVELACAGEDAPRVVFELIPRRATMLVLDAGGEVCAAWKPRRGRPTLGDVYAPPGADRRTPPDEVGDDIWDKLRALPDRDELVRGLLRTIAGMSPLVAREIAHRHGAGTPLPQAARDEIERATRAPAEPRIYAPRPISDLTEPPPARRFLLAPYPLRHTEQRQRPAAIDPYPTLIEAAAAFYPLRACLDGLQAARVSLASALEIAVARAQRALDAVADDADSVGDAGRHRQRADLLLAYPTAPVEGAVVRVPDPYAGGGAEMEIQIDPSMSLIDNAQAYYRRARRAERGAARTAARRDTLRRRETKLLELLDETRRARQLSTCVRIARQARTHRVSVDDRAWMRPECTQSRSETEPTVPERAAADEPRPRTAGTSASDGPSRDGTDPARKPRRATPAGVDAFTSSDGFEILVGRSARGNEVVTRKLAAPHDFWLHAEGPGSHVVIRNPTRDEQPSDDALRQAASLAAYFSRSRGATKVNVRWTQARHVKKPRGAPAGQVVLRRSKTFLAEPLPPDRLFAGDDED